MGCKKPDNSLALNFLLKTYEKVADSYSFVKILGGFFGVNLFTISPFSDPFPGERKQKDGRLGEALEIRLELNMSAVRVYPA